MKTPHSKPAIGDKFFLVRYSDHRPGEGTVQKHTGEVTHVGTKYFTVSWKLKLAPHGNEYNFDEKFVIATRLSTSGYLPHTIYLNEEEYDLEVQRLAIIREFRAAFEPFNRNINFSLDALLEEARALNLNQHNKPEAYEGV